MKTGGALGGSGKVGGDVVIEDGGKLAPGNSPGTLTIAGDLTLNPASVLDFEFGHSNVVGGPMNDLVKVGGDPRPGWDPERHGVRRRRGVRRRPLPGDLL